MNSVLKEVQQERERQEAKWGEQNHADGTGPKHFFLGRGMEGPVTYDFLRDRATWITDSHTNIGRITYADILLEEVFEAVAEDDQDKLREELIQVAAVSVAWVQKIDRDKVRPARKAKYLPGDLVALHVTSQYFKEYDGCHGVVTYGPDDSGGWQVAAATGQIRCIDEELTLITRREDR